VNETAWTISQLRADHRQWKNEHDVWRTEARQWEVECETALSELDKLRQLVQQHAAELKAHVRLINSHEASLELHERMLGDAETHGRSPWPKDAALESHEQQAVAHFENRDAHQHIKLQQQLLAARLRAWTVPLGTAAKKDDESSACA
jgi:hypothetical protein